MVAVLWAGSSEAPEKLVRDFYAPVLLGAVFSTFLFGINVSQFVKYATYGRQNPAWTHFIVALVFVTDTVQEVLAVYNVWFLSVQNFGNYDALVLPFWPTPVSLGILMAVIATVVQQYFIWHVKTFSQSWSLFGFLTLCSLASSVIALVNAILWLKSATIYTQRVQVCLTETSLGLVVFVNLVNAIVLLYYLLRHRSGFKRTDSAIRQLITSCVKTPLLNALVSLIDIVLYKITFPTTYTLMIAYPMGRVYTLSLLALVNSQTSLREDWHGVTDLDTHHPPRRGGRLSRSLRLSRPPEHVRVGVTIEQHAKVEVDPFARTKDRGRRSSRRSKTETTSVGSAKEREHELADLKFTV
ncbi:hypothetical protein DAEQUDRAFT_729399 [Daedalea quercina L-15889]|uniref:DUF6534 domain-containing protein n=1 Tax=Daedalea quercina L-15889 TaxID=1314783 RepID=A0A165NMW8_9APHY|nr:hypothetical protein DAEQUDRAFT_729399 [Daedalea quercina L-15889]